MNKSDREVVLATLKEILDEGAYTNVALRRVLATQSHLTPTQRAFVTDLVSGLIRNLLLIDYIIAAFSKTPINRIKPTILHILRLSVYQIKFMDKVPMHAACNEAVKMAKKTGFVGLSGFVNGVLRNIVRSEDLPPLPQENVDLTGHLSVKYSTQPWIVQHFLEELGADCTKALLENVGNPPKITICVNTNKTTIEDLSQILEKEGVTVAPALLPNMLTLSKTSDIAGLTSFKQGLYHIMDQAAALAVLCANPAPNAQIIDICAAPGGKCFLSAYLAGQNAEILACDIHSHKIKLLQDGAKRLGIQNFTANLSDAGKHQPELVSTADLLILDMPCSGLGTLRRKPDIKLNKHPKTIEELASLSREIIAASWQYTKIGGKILFCTCTIANAENIHNFRWMLENFPLKPVDISPNIPIGLEFATAKQGYIQILPQDLNTDGFFMAVLERVE